MSYAGSLTAQLLRAAVAGRTGFKEGEILGQKDRLATENASRDDARAALVAAAQAAAANRTAGLVDPNSPEVLADKNTAALKLHASNRLFDVAHPTRDMSGSTPGYDKAALRMRAAYKAKLMAPVNQRFGPPRAGMSEEEAEDLATQAWGPAEGRAADAPSTSTRALLSGSILRGGGAAAASRGGSSTSSTPTKTGGGTSARVTSSAPANDPKLNVGGGKKKGNIDLAAAPTASSAIPTGVNLKERDMEPADLWDKKVREGMTPVQATAYVKRLKGTA